MGRVGMAGGTLVCLVGCHCVCEAGCTQGSTPAPLLEGSWGRCPLHIFEDVVVHDWLSVGQNCTVGSQACRHLLACLVPVLCICDGCGQPWMLPLWQPVLLAVAPSCLQDLASISLGCFGWALMAPVLRGQHTTLALPRRSCIVTVSALWLECLVVQIHINGPDPDQESRGMYLVCVWVLGCAEPLLVI